ILAPGGGQRIGEKKTAGEILERRRGRDRQPGDEREDDAARRSLPERRRQAAVVLGESPAPFGIDRRQRRDLDPRRGRLGRGRSWSEARGRRLRLRRSGRGRDEALRRREPDRRALLRRGRKDEEA